MLFITGCRCLQGNRRRMSKECSSCSHRLTFIQLADAVSHIHVPAEQWIGMTDKEKAIKPIKSTVQGQISTANITLPKRVTWPF